MPLRRILMIAEKFPPHATSGTARPYFFARHLPEFGYRPVVLTSPLLRGEASDPALLRDLPDDVEIVRAVRPMAAARAAVASEPWGRVPPAGDETTAGEVPKPPGISARVSRMRATAAWFALWHLDWLPPAFVRGVATARRDGVELVWVTAPHMKNLVLGYALSRRLRKPLIVDLRDPWTYGSLWRPVSPLAEKIERGWAEKILREASLIVFASPLTQQETEARFPELRGRCTTITNGYSKAEAAITPLRGGFAGKFLLRHTGALSARRTPDVLLRALRLVLERQPALRSTLHLEFVGDPGGHEARLSDSGRAPCVSARGQVSRAESLALMRGADVNVLLQTVTAGTDVIAGKTFDYLAAEKPVLAAVDPAGGDAWLLRQFRGAVMTPCANADAVAGAILELHALWTAGALPAAVGDLAQYERRHLSRRLAEELDRL